VLALRCGCNDDCSAYNESNDDLIFLESSDDLIFHFAPASQALGLKYRQQFKGQGQLNTVVVKYFLSGPPRSGGGPVRFTPQSGHSPHELSCLRNFYFGKAKYKAGSVSGDADVTDPASCTA
jgi:hypothetical protein